VSPDMDELARTLAGEVSGGEALKRTFVAAVRALLPRSRRGRTQNLPNDCARFCSAFYGEDSPEAISCVLLSEQGTGPCYEFGPHSPACSNNKCPPTTVCVSIDRVATTRVEVAVARAAQGHSRRLSGACIPALPLPDQTVLGTRPRRGVS
jgi:hypothetical protein